MFDVLPVWNAVDAEHADRGDVILSSGGSIGRFVGLGPGGILWVAWHGIDYPAMCEAIDQQVSASHNRRNAP